MGLIHRSLCQDEGSGGGQTVGCLEMG